MSDPLDDLLTPKGEPASDAVREGILAGTLDALRRRDRPPRVPVWLLLLAVAAGMLMIAGHSWRPPAQTPAPPQDSGGVRPPLAPAPASPEEIEWKALEEDPRLYRDAAEGYLDDGRPAEAVRCYGHALDASGDLEVKKDDDFLLTAIKLARKKEREACER
jgi:hypothetical protein